MLPVWWPLETVPEEQTVSAAVPLRALLVQTSQVAELPHVLPQGSPQATQPPEAAPLELLQ